MSGHYDAARQLGFVIAGADLVVNLDGLVLRGEYLVRRTDMAVAPGGVDPHGRWKYAPDVNGNYDDHYFKHGFYAEAEVPIGPVDAFARFDGLLRFGNVLAAGAAGATAETSALSSTSKVWRYTGGVAIRISDNIRLKASAEYYQFSDFANEVALHLGVATPF